VWIDAIAQGHGPSPKSIGSVHFAPGARTAWHSHSIGQTLYVTEGEGRVQSRGEPVATIRPGDVIHSGLGQSHVGGLSWGGGLALEFYRRHPGVVRTLILASAYAGWEGSLPADVVEQRLQLMLRNSERPPDRWAPALVDTFFSKGAPPEIVREALSIVSDLHPGATRVAMQAFARADLRDVLPRIDVPTLVLCGEEDVRAPRHVWEALHSEISGSKLVLIPGVGHVIDIEAAERFNTEAKAFLRA
jgi:pimeloyl-ACP methyl ester carboxylesterase